MAAWQSTLKWLIPVGLLTLPWWVGFPLFWLHLDPPAYFLMAIVPQYAIDPYYSHYGASRFADGWLPAAFHWSLLLALYGLLSRGRSLRVSLLLFAGLSILSVLLAHAFLSICGYKFVLDTI